MEDSTVAGDDCANSDLRFLIVTLNAGEQRLDPQVLHHALNDALCNASRKASVDPNSVAAVVLALQEPEFEAESCWGEAMSYAGFPRRVAGSFSAGKTQQVAVHARMEEHGTDVVVETDGAAFMTKAFPAEPGDVSSKGVTAARLRVQREGERGEPFVVRRLYV